ncbi:putative transposase OrfB (plasmid) [Variovorax sp. PBL-E5]|nr:putative transposase OrfB [Variovorax sp. PBL-E5]
MLIVELRKRRMLQARIARSVGISESTVSRVLARAGMSKLSDLEPVEAVVRYEHQAPGDLLHIDTKKLGRIVRRLLTDNGPAFRSREFRASCVELGIKHSFTRPYRPQTNGKAERFIQSALREWAYGWTYLNSAHRTDALASWQHHYNWHRPHSGIAGLVPMSRLNSSRNNLLTLHS